VKISGTEAPADHCNRHCDRGFEALEAYPELSCRYKGKRCLPCVASSTIAPNSPPNAIANAEPPVCSPSSAGSGESGRRPATKQDQEMYIMGKLL